MEKKVIITYETLYEILRREKIKPEIQVLDDTFFKDVISYIADKESILESQSKKDSIFSSTELEKTRKQIDNVRKILRELYEKREQKIIQLALMSSRTNSDIESAKSLLPEERAFYDDLHNLLIRANESILKNILSGKMPLKLEKAHLSKPKEINSASQGEDNKLVRIINPVPKFMGTSLEVYGPFESEALVNLPSEIASLLIKHNKAEELKT